MTKVFVTGGSGTLGRKVIERLVNEGMEVCALTRNPGADFPARVIPRFADLSSSTDLATAANGSELVIHCASNPKDHVVADGNGTSNLLHALRNAKPRHLIYISIAGVERSRYPYYRTKFAVEKMIQDSGIPWSILRATQFHDLVLERIIRQSDKGDGNPLIIPARMRFQSVDTGDVVDAIVALTRETAMRSVVTIAGPEVLTLEEMARQYLAVQKRSDPIHSEDTRNEFHDVFRSGVNLSADGKLGKVTWKEFLNFRFS